MLISFDIFFVFFLFLFASWTESLFVLRVSVAGENNNIPNYKTDPEGRVTLAAFHRFIQTVRRLDVKLQNVEAFSSLLRATYNSSPLWLWHDLSTIP